MVRPPRAPKEHGRGDGAAQGLGARDTEKDGGCRLRPCRDAGPGAASGVSCRRRPAGATGLRNLQHAASRTDPSRSPAASRRPPLPPRHRGRLGAVRIRKRTCRGRWFPWRPGDTWFRASMPWNGDRRRSGRRWVPLPAGRRNAWGPWGWRLPAMTAVSPGRWQPWGWPWNPTPGSLRFRLRRLSGRAARRREPTPAPSPGRRGCW